MRETEEGASLYPQGCHKSLCGGKMLSIGFVVIPFVHSFSAFLSLLCAPWGRPLLTVTWGPTHQLLVGLSLWQVLAGDGIPGGGRLVDT